MRRIGALLGGLLAAALLTGAAPAGAAEVPPAPVALDQGWQYKADPQDVGRFSGWFADPGPDGWEDRPVPSVFDPDPIPSEFLGTVGWYRVRFRAPASPADWALHFGEVRRFAQVWLNGRRIGSSRDGYVPFDLAAKGLQPGADNLLVVRVDNRKTLRTFREGWWNWGGIIRPVSLVPQGRAQLSDLGLLSRVRCATSCRASVLALGSVRNGSTTPLSPEVAVRLTAPDGSVSEKTVPLGSVEPGASVPVRFSVPVGGTPELWSPGHPALYDALVQTRVGGAIEQADRLRIGLRSVKVKHGLIYLNGRQLNLRGASIQEDLEGNGPALSDAGVEQIVSDLKSLHANVTRAHYLLDDRLLRRFDEEGIMVWSQAAVYHRDLELRTEAGRADALHTVRGTVLAARNHPSVFTHSVANELSPTPDIVAGTRRFMVSAARLTRRLDPTLPVSVDLLSYPDFPKQRTYERFDLLGINSYFGWYKGKAEHYVGDFSTLRPYLRTMRERYPKQAMMMTEFGAEATIDGPAREKQTYAFQSNYLRRVLKVVDETPWLGGAIYWTAREFAVKPNWDGGANRAGIRTDAIHNKGLITYDGRRKPAAGVAARLFGRAPWYR